MGVPGGALIPRLGHRGGEAAFWLLGLGSEARVQSLLSPGDVPARPRGWGRAAKSWGCLRGPEGQACPHVVICEDRGPTWAFSPNAQNYE